MLDTEMDLHLGRRREGVPETPAETAADTPAPWNRRNGRSCQALQGDLGEIVFATPRDRHGTFEPQLIPKHQRRLPGFDEKTPLMCFSR